MLSVWAVALDQPDAVVAELAATLSDDERARAERFVHARDRRRFVVARGALRSILGGELGVEPGLVRLVYGASGKPALDPVHGDDPRFNVSHSGELALVALASGRAVGVDVEQVRAMPDREAVAARFFSPGEQAALIGRPDAAFFRTWTRKEAYLKARGDGLARLADEPEPGWSLIDLAPPAGYVAALCVEGGPLEVSWRRWTASAAG